MSYVQIVGPFNSRELVVDGWTVPFITNVVETTGGVIHFTLDHRLGFDCGAKDFEPFARFLADSIAVALGLPSHPSGDLSFEETQRMWALLPHTAVAPRRMNELGGISQQPDNRGGE